MSKYHPVILSHVKRVYHTAKLTGIDESILRESRDVFPKRYYPADILSKAVQKASNFTLMKVCSPTLVNRITKLLLNNYTNDIAHFPDTLSISILLDTLRLFFYGN